MSNRDIEHRARQAAIAGAIKGVHEQFPNYNTEVHLSAEGYKVSIMISHPTAMDGRVIIGVEA